MYRAFPRERFEFLDAMRGVAAIAVALFHARHQISPYLLPGGYLAVDLFFCLSGFVIAHAYDQRLAAGLGFAEFARARLIRLWPMYAVGAALGAVLGALSIGGADGMSSGHLAATAGLSVFFLPTWGSWLYPYDWPAWSLILELGINAAYALGFRWLTVRRLLVFAALAAPLILAYAIYKGQTNIGAQWNGVPVGVARVVFSFAVGAALYRLRPRLRFPRPPGWALLAVMLAVFAAPVLEGGRAWIDAGFIFLVSPALVLAGSRAAPFWGGRVLGDISYPLYAIHYPLIGLTIIAFGQAAGPMVVMAALSPLLAYLLAVKVDYPARQWLASLAQARPSETHGVRAERQAPTH